MPTVSLRQSFPSREPLHCTVHSYLSDNPHMGDRGTSSNQLAAHRPVEHCLPGASADHGTRNRSNPTSSSKHRNDGLEPTSRNSSASSTPAIDRPDGIAPGNFCMPMAYAAASLALSASLANASGRVTARCASIFRSRSTPACRNPLMRRE